MLSYSGSFLRKCLAAWTLYLSQFYVGQSFYSFMEDQFDLLAEAAALDDNQNVKIMIKIIKISEFRYPVLVFYHKQPSC